jgi:hypothetical protein
MGPAQVPPAGTAQGQAPFPSAGGEAASAYGSPSAQQGGFGPPQAQGPQGFGAYGPPPTAQSAGPYGAPPDPPAYGSPSPFGATVVDPGAAQTAQTGQTGQSAFGAPGAPPGYGAPPQDAGIAGGAYAPQGVAAFDPTVPAPGGSQVVAGQAIVPVVGAQGGPMMAPVAPAAPGVHGPRGTVRSGLKCLGLGIVTCGVYMLIWFASSCNEMAVFLQRDEPSWVKILALSIVTCGFYGVYWQLTRCGALVQECQLRAGVPNPQNHGWHYLIPYYNVVLMTDELNKAWQGPA